MNIKFFNVLGGFFIILHLSSVFIFRHFTLNNNMMFKIVPGIHRFPGTPWQFTTLGSLLFNVVALSYGIEWQVVLPVLVLSKFTGYSSLFSPHSFFVVESVWKTCHDLSFPKPKFSGPHEGVAKVSSEEVL